ncbi:hypothetical protein ACSW0U_001301 [Vibrio fluvialis]|uniref:hypothetical protein n=1 Tax=Vibrio fluvialis TaxID=676 RepID=UPI0013030778|nr:hypothetical protein [Vibrio fluvialis]
MKLFPIRKYFLTTFKPLISQKADELDVLNDALKHSMAPIHIDVVSNSGGKISEYERLVCNLEWALANGKRVHIDFRGICISCGAVFFMKSLELSKLYQSCTISYNELTYLVFHQPTIDLSNMGKLVANNDSKNAFCQLNEKFEHLDKVASKYFEKYFHECLDLFVEDCLVDVLKEEYASLAYDGTVKDIPIAINDSVRSEYFKLPT